MADSIEQQIITAVVTRLNTINGTGSYQTSIGTTVEDSRANWDQAELPAISVHQGRTTSEEADDEGISVFRKMAVMIECTFESLGTPAGTAAFARKCVSDIYLAVRSYDKWSSLATFTSEVSHAMVRPENSYEITGVQVEIMIEYKAAKFNMES